MVNVVFQSIFCLEMHLNNFFFIFLNLFLTSVHQNNSKILKKLIWSKQILNFNKKQVQPHLIMSASIIYTFVAKEWGGKISFGLLWDFGWESNYVCHM